MKAAGAHQAPSRNYAKLIEDKVCAEIASDQTDTSGKRESLWIKLHSKIPEGVDKSHR